MGKVKLSRAISTAMEKHGNGKAWQWAVSCMPMPLKATGIALPLVHGQQELHDHPIALLLH